MRRVTRAALPSAAQAYLNRRQAATDQNLGLGRLNIERDWKAARQTKALAVVLKSLKQTLGVRERCMYCVDSHGSDIDHFRPKARFPGHTFKWSNMLLCCTECGRFKGGQFPMAGRRGLLIDPTNEDPWQHLDFDPDTGCVTARFDVEADDWSAKGATTVAVLRLDRREAMAAGYVNTYRRLAGIVQASLPSLTGGSMTAPTLLVSMRHADDHGLLPWCFNGTGQTFWPFSELRDQCPHIWADCSPAVI